MNKLQYLLFAAIALIAVACNNDDKKDQEDEKTIEITEAFLNGTWEGGVEADLAQGYPQNWRIKFDGNEYTTWHTHQTVGTINDDVEGLKTVGNKEKGTWTYADGILTLTPQQQWASYAITSMTPMKYSYYEYNTETMEAVQWYETSASLIEMGIESDLQNDTDFYVKKLKVVSCTNNSISIKINMDTFKLDKK
jgi:hypothetical protein